MDESKQEEYNLLEKEYNKIAKEMFENDEGGIILDSGRIVPVNGYEYRNELERKRYELFLKMQELKES